MTGAVILLPLNGIHRVTVLYCWFNDLLCLMFLITALFYSLYRLFVSRSLLQLFTVYTSFLCHVTHYCTSLLRLFTVYTGCFSHVPLYCTFYCLDKLFVSRSLLLHFLLFIQVVSRSSSRQSVALYRDILSHVTHYCTYLLFIQVVLLTFLSTALIYRLYRLF
jgi:hypothetical protein